MQGDQPGARDAAPTDHVFLLWRKPLSTRYCGMRLDTYGKRCAARITPHQLRDSFRMLLLNADVPTEGLQGLLGHTNIEKTLAPALVSGLVDVWVFNRGTEAHEGGSGELMEMLAERVSQRANVGRDGPEYSHYWPRFLIQGVDVMFGHHPASGSRLYHTRHQPAARTATHYWNGFNVPVITKNSISYDREKPPDVMFSGHLHYDADSGVDASNPIRVFYVASWQLPYSFIHRIGRGAIPNAVGCRWLWCQDGEYRCKPWLHRPAAGKAVEL